MTTIYHWKQSKKNNIHSGPNQHELGVLTSLCDFVPVGGKPPRFCGSTFRWARHAGHVCDTPIDCMRWSAVPLFLLTVFPMTSSGASTQKPKFQRVLWCKQPYPDNYQDLTFLNHLHRNRTDDADF